MTGIEDRLDAFARKHPLLTGILGAAGTVGVVKAYERLRSRDPKDSEEEE